MKQLLLFFLFIGLTISAYAQVFKNKELSISQLESDLWVIETADMTTMYLIEGRDKALLIDTGTKCTNLKEVVQKITQKPLYVVLTHVHADHAGNLNYFDDVYFHKSDSVLMDRLPLYKGQIHYIDDGDTFELGEKQIVVRHMPGHTPGSIVLLDYQTGYCYSGDAFGSGQVWLQLWPYSSMRTYANSCEKMERIMNLGINKIYCGHYPYVKTTFDKNYISSMLDLALKIHKNVAQNVQRHHVLIPDIGCKNPMMVTENQVTIVYDPEHIK